MPRPQDAHRRQLARQRPGRVGRMIIQLMIEAGKVYEAYDVFKHTNGAGKVYEAY